MLLGTVEPAVRVSATVASDQQREGTLDVHWIHGSRSRRHRTDPPLQVHRYTDDTFIIRQSKDLTYEAPFVFLLFGDDRALLLDTGDLADDTLRGTVDELVAAWLQRHPREGYQLVVAHTHAHGDHIAGDASFLGRPDTVVVGTSMDDVCAFLGFTTWPDGVVTFDLGGRPLDVIAIPGHEPASIACYDTRTGLLLTGDTVYPGRIYVRDVPAFVASINRLVDLAAERDVTHLLGCHIEMTRTAGRDYPLGCRYQPDEPPLQMSVDQLREIQRQVKELDGRSGVHRLDDVILYFGMGPTTQARLLARGLVEALRDRLRRR